MLQVELLTHTQAMRELVWELAFANEPFDMERSEQALIGAIFSGEMLYLFDFVLRVTDDNDASRLFILENKLGECQTIGGGQYIWKCNGQQLMHVLCQSRCWLFKSNGGIDSIFNQLDKVSTGFRLATVPPCFRRDHLTDCPFVVDNQMRLYNIGELPCPLALGLMDPSETPKEMNGKPRRLHPSNKSVSWDSTDAQTRIQYKKDVIEFGKRLGRNPWTGEEVK